MEGTEMDYGSMSDSEIESRSHNASESNPDLRYEYNKRGLGDDDDDTGTPAEPRPGFFDYGIGKVVAYVVCLYVGLFVLVNIITHFVGMVGEHPLYVYTPSVVIAIWFFASSKKSKVMYILLRVAMMAVLTQVYSMLIGETDFGWLGRTIYVGVWGGIVWYLPKFMVKKLLSRQNE